MATKRKATATEAPAPLPLAEDPVPEVRCVNCGAPAVWRTTNPGAVSVDFCDRCGARTYPGLEPWLEGL
jgi:hypothetical protein